MIEMTDTNKNCNYQGNEFGSKDYPDSICINGFLYDADSWDGTGYTIPQPDEKKIPCPKCNKKEETFQIKVANIIYENVDDGGIGTEEASNLIKQLHDQDLLKEYEKGQLSIKYQKCNTHNQLEDVFTIIKEREDKIQKLKEENDLLHKINTEALKNNEKNFNELMELKGNPARLNFLIKKSIDKNENKQKSNI
jgi:hypothetical protein